MNENVNFYVYKDILDFSWFDNNLWEFYDIDLLRK